MTKTTVRRAALAACLTGLAFWTGAAHAQVRPENLEDDEKSWSELALALPAAPKPENLIPFKVGATAAMSFAVDALSLTVGTDGVVRYTLVAISPSGVKNVSFEGVRCASFEMKAYAFGRDDGSWSKSRRDQWEGIPNSNPNSAQGALAREYFCLGKTVDGKAAGILRKLRGGQKFYD